MKFELLPVRKKCFCAYCKTPRKVYRNKNLSLFTILGLIGLSVVLTKTIWHNIDTRGLFILAFILITGEVCAQIKWRGSMICNNCGFDAVLYVRNPEAAGLKIKEFMEYRSTRPEYLLRPSIPLPKRKVHSKNTEGLSLRG